jgi:hypothetical protein
VVRVSWIVSKTREAEYFKSFTSCGRDKNCTVNCAGRLRVFTYLHVTANKIPVAVHVAFGL